MKTTFVSISVPIYNTEKYLRKCLDSLVNQTLKEIEIILVNDGSTDRSESICVEYAKKDSRIKLISKNNGGLASARQAALEVAQGDYFCACDSDDWVEPTMYERLYKKALENDADIVMCDYWAEYPDKGAEKHVLNYTVKKEFDMLDDALNGKLPCQVWNKLFKRSLFSKYNITWEPGINLGEDFLIMLKILQQVIKVEYLPETLYHYRREMGGTSYRNNISFSTFQQSLYIRKWAICNIDTKKYSNGMFRLWLSLAFTGLRVKENMSRKFYKEEVLSHIPYSGFIKYTYPKMKGCLVLFTKLFGYTLGKIVYKFMYRFVYS